MASKPTLLIDGDLVLFKGTVAVEREICWDGENWTLHSNAEEAWVAVEDQLHKLFKRFKTEEHVIAFTSSPTFRHALSPSYKGNRVGQRKPVAYAATKERLGRKGYTIASEPALEADDVLGILATRNPDDTIICSTDKDMRTVPCMLWDDKELTKITEAEADYKHLYQTLVGDASDGYPGCPGIGPVKAAKLLDATAWTSDCGLTWPQAMWMQVAAAFEKAKLTEEDALLQARLARILRVEDWDAEKREPILWQP
jgi:5'-3' exonuclease